MRKALLFILSCLYCINSFAQDWKTVRLEDTSYFIAGKHRWHQFQYHHQAPFPPMADSPLLRMMFVQGSTTVGSDSVFGFYSTLRDTGNFHLLLSDCIDTLGPSWLGAFFIRKANGTEYYFNSRKDTITILTAAALGASWALAKDTGGNVFIGTVTQAGVMNIDGTPDSFKTISIQAYSGSNPISHEYNAEVLQFSKSHGWIKTLDFYRFPNTISYSDWTGIAVDSNAHVRLPAAFSKGRMHQNIQWKYFPGNEWIWKWEGGFTFNPDNSARYYSFVDDSVTSFVSLGQGVGLATIHTVKYDSSHVYESTQAFQGYRNASVTTISVHTDTVRDLVASSNPINVEQGWLSAMGSRYFAWPYDTARYFFTRADLGRYRSRFINGCLRVEEIETGGDDWTHFETYLPDFGLTGKYIMETNTQNGAIKTAEYGRYIYIKTGPYSFGAKVNVLKLDVPEQSGTGACRVFPNPANDMLTIVVPEQHAGLELSLHNVTGEVVLRQRISGIMLNVPTGNLPAGFYFLYITAKESRQTFKVLIQH